MKEFEIISATLFQRMCWVFGISGFGLCILGFRGLG